ncbi:hypothetical protein HAX54_010569, partial [Datura stramonium]|nr:hypothetical protein [Datura stramonium]
VPQDESYNGPLYCTMGRCTVPLKGPRSNKKLLQRKKFPKSNSLNMSQSQKALVVPRRPMRLTPRINLQLRPLGHKPSPRKLLRSLLHLPNLNREEKRSSQMVMTLLWMIQRRERVLMRIRENRRVLMRSQENRGVTQTLPLHWRQGPKDGLYKIPVLPPSVLSVLDEDLNEEISQFFDLDMASSNKGKKKCANERAEDEPRKEQHEKVKVAGSFTASIVPSGDGDDPLGEPQFVIAIIPDRSGGTLIAPHGYSIIESIGYN